MTRRASSENLAQFSSLGNAIASSNGDRRNEMMAVPSKPLRSYPGTEIRLRLDHVLDALFVPECRGARGYRGQVSGYE
jgi:hypothetical protein